MSGNVSGSIYRVLMSQGRANGLAGTSGVREMGAGLPRGNKTDPLTAQAGESREPMGMGTEKDAPVRARQFTGRERQNAARMGGEPFPGCVADIVDIATRKGARVVRYAPFLAVMEGGQV